jgi:hypothetical protein
VAHPDAELRDERPVEAEARPDRGDILGGRRVPCEDRRRVARREPQQEEDKDGDDEEDRNGPQQPPCDEVGQFFLMFQ